MDETAFWAPTEAANAEAREQQADQAKILKEKLQTLPAGEIIAFNRSSLLFSSTPTAGISGLQLTLSAGGAATTASRISAPV
jgi:Protein of unknown function (DUF4240)